MAYSIDRAALLTKQFERFAHSNVHQLAGQVANLEFWIDEAIYALRTIDEYPGRFRRLRDAQVAWVRAHGTKVSGYCEICGGACEFGPQSPMPPQRIPSDQMEEARARLRRAAYAFLLRCYRSGLLLETGVRAAGDRIGIVVESEDLKRDHGDGERETPTPGGLDVNAITKSGGPQPSKRRR
jgi:hypothetical protein